MEILKTAVLLFLLYFVSVSAQGFSEKDLYDQRSQLENCQSIRDNLFFRSDFPEDFTWGVGTSAGQVEGAAFQDDRTASAWDVFSLIPGKIVDESNATVACDYYHKIKEDLNLVYNMGVNSYRFSISWSRLLPNGKKIVNPTALKFYSSILDDLVIRGIEPLITLHHMDLPKELDEIGGWVNAQIIDEYVSYAKVCFDLFADRVKSWTTLNEPFHVAVFEFGSGVWPPGRCSNRETCLKGNSTTEPYYALHNMLLAHGKIVKLFRDSYQWKNDGQIGITLEGPFFYPYDNSTESLRAVERAFTWRFRWAFDPLIFGDYPKMMRDILGSRLPSFTKEEKEMLRGSVDYYGLNFYTGSFTKEKKIVSYPGSYTDQVQNDGKFEEIYVDFWGNDIGPPSGFSFRPQVPRALFDLLMWIDKSYPSLPIIIGENGYPSANPEGIKGEMRLCDFERVNFFNEHLAAVIKALKNGVNLKAFYAWSLLDSWEWSLGYTILHGLVYVNFSSPLRERVPKASFMWWSNFLSKNTTLVSHF